MSIRLIVTGYMPMRVAPACREKLRTAGVMAAVHIRHGSYRNACKGGMTPKITLCNDNTIITRLRQKCVELTNEKMAIQREETGQFIAGCDLVCRSTTDQISP